MTSKFTPLLKETDYNFNFLEKCYFIRFRKKWYVYEAANYSLTVSLYVSYLLQSIRKKNLGKWERPDVYFKTRYFKRADTLKQSILTLIELPYRLKKTS